jgi:hypothetical protein
MSARTAAKAHQPARPRVLRALVLLLALCPIALAAAAEQARAVILPAVTLDGPSSTIVSFGGVAMAEDGSGGVVYLKRVEGVPHVFVARYLDGHWTAPIRVDTGEPYAASWPRIGAADDGELVVVWATPFATSHEHPVDELLGATLGPGASAFGPAMIVDSDIREGVGASPDLAMSSTGQADVVYRVVEGEANAITQVRALHPGDVIETVRVAHFDGARWTNLGAINRNPAVSMRPPTAANAPQIAIGPTNTGVVVWQEPETGNHGGGARLRPTPVRIDARLRTPRERDELRRQADRTGRGSAERVVHAPRPGRGRLSPALGCGLAARGPADLREHAARR